MSIEFHNTILGRRFIEGTMPELVRQITRLNDNLEKKANTVSGDDLTKVEDNLLNHLTDLTRTVENLSKTHERRLDDLERR